MSYFDVKLDGVSIHDPKYREMTLKDAKVSLSLGEAGSFTFTLPKEHVFADVVTPFGSTIEVFEDGNSIFYGRPLAPKIDMYGRKTYHCEGPLAFLNDVICPPGAAGLSAEMDDKDYLTFVVNYYNSQVGNKRKIYIDSNWPITPVNPAHVHVWKYKTAKDEIRSEVLQYTGGYLYTTRTGGKTYLCWIDYPLYENLQPIEAGINVRDAIAEGQPFYTAAIASGKQNMEELIPTTGEIVQMLYPGILSQAAVDQYGFMCAYLDAGEADSIQTLETYCSEWLASQQFDGQSFDIGALDLHVINQSYPMFLFGRYGARVSIPTMALEKLIPITGIEIDVNTGRKRLKVGMTEYKTMTKQITDQKNEEDQLKDSMPDYDGTLKDPDGNSYIPSVDGEGNIVVTKIPEYITFTRVYAHIYIPGEALDLSNYEVSAIYGDGTSEVITSACIFNPADGYVFVSEQNPITLCATYVIAGRTYETGCSLATQKEEPDGYIGTLPVKAITNGTKILVGGSEPGFMEFLNLPATQYIAQQYDADGDLQIIFLAEANSGQCALQYHKDSGSTTFTWYYVQTKSGNWYYSINGGSSSYRNIFLQDVPVVSGVTGQTIAALPGTYTPI